MNIVNFTNSKIEELNDRKKFAFTLAEVLITLGVVGVVAALTLPVLSKNINEYVTKQKVKKAYADLQQAFELVKKEEDVYEYFNCTEIYCTRPLVQKIIQKYRTRKSKFYNADYPQYKSITGITWTGNNILHQTYLINDSVSISYWTYNAKTASIWIDINSYKNPPNTLGKDMFVFVLKNNKIFPVAASPGIDSCKTTGYDQSFPKQDTNSNYYLGAGCTAKYVYGK